MWIVWKVICRKGDTEQARGRCADDEPASCGEGKQIFIIIIIIMVIIIIFIIIIMVIIIITIIMTRLPAVERGSCCWFVHISYCLHAINIEIC